MAFVYGLLVNYLSVFARERHVMANPGYFFLLMSLGLILSRLFAGGMIDKGYIGRLILGGKGTILLASPASSSCPRKPCSSAQPWPSGSASG